MAAPKKKSDSSDNSMAWWNNKSFTKELGNRYNAWVKGKEKGFSLSDIDSSLEQMSKKRSLNNHNKAM